MRTFMFVVLLGTIVSIVSSCDDENNSENKGFGTITGVVIDDTGVPVIGATVTVSGIEETVSTGTDGKYTVENVSIETHAVTFFKVGYQKISLTVTESKFDGNKIATTQVIMINASSKISGTVLDGKNGGKPLAGVIVSLGADESVVTGSDGKYLLENLVTGDYTITFTKTDYPSLTKIVSKDSFVDGVVTLDFTMGGKELLRDLTLSDLLLADKWYYSDYHGGRNADAYPRWDWSVDYLSTLDFRGTWEEQNEGTTLQIRNSGNEQKNPADLDVFDSFVYGSKKITDDNKILSLRLRTHSADAASPAYYGVQVVDLSSADPKAVKIGETKTYGSGDYGDSHFDLSAYVGKEIIIAVGIYRKDTGDYWKQLVLRRIAFAQEKVTNWNWIPGAEAVDEWKLTKEMVRSTMIQSKKSFTGISPVSGNRDNYVGAYRSWRTVNHIAAKWAFVPLKKDPEIFGAEGYAIKTRNTAEVNTEVPEAYFYAKFPIASGNNQLTLKTRNYGSNYTYFKLTAIKEDGTVVHIAPKSNTAKESSAAENGCWKFKHDAGDTGKPESYASFVYDLSQFNGNNVVLAFGVYNGVANSGENKLVFYSVDLK